MEPYGIPCRICEALEIILLKDTGCILWDIEKMNSRGRKKLYNMIACLITCCGWFLEQRVIGHLSVSVLLACASIFISGSPGLLSGLKSVETCTDSLGYQETGCLQNFDYDVFSSACVWIGFCCKCLGLLSVLLGKRQMEEDNCKCKIIPSILTLLSALCYVFEFVYEEHFDVKITASKFIAGLGLYLDLVSFLELVRKVSSETAELRYGKDLHYIHRCVIFCRKHRLPVGEIIHVITVEETSALKCQHHVYWNLWCLCKHIDLEQSMFNHTMDRGEEKRREQKAIEQKRGEEKRQEEREEERRREEKRREARRREEKRREETRRDEKRRQEKIREKKRRKERKYEEKRKEDERREGKRREEKRGEEKRREEERREKKRREERKREKEVTGEEKSRGKNRGEERRREDRKRGEKKKEVKKRASLQPDDLRLSGPPSSQGADGGARILDRRVPTDLSADSLATMPRRPH
ncbi:reticulocyte-binding protein 2 homolog a [Plakobranchus ocellatus]|uniref:Reticulocyte-binding protein 2 homolog a n=1 Tax=Plakobranchus ocellatus TaxID=259542 RepID=A0AAV4CM00_9GAST|nr:reticulocyte-binding protein 2 homolog a [Plakobranchus ocellatus]